MVHDKRKQGRRLLSVAGVFTWVALAWALGGCGPKRPQQPIQGEVVKSVSFRGNSGFFGDVTDSTLREVMEQRQSDAMWWMDRNERAVTLDRIDGPREESVNDAELTRRATARANLATARNSPTFQRPQIIRI